MIKEVLYLVFEFLGALGLFLLGMWMMTDGLKLAGGRALEALLSSWISSRLKGLIAGITITGIVQSSSAVTIATLGFVNAGIISFNRALWFVFGSNVGTTFNAWIITLFGFSFKISAITFPLIGIGALIRLFCNHERAKALGLALAGFALLFLGIDALKDSFSAHSNSFAWLVAIDQSDYRIVFSLTVGFILTVITQSSGAAIAIILTAVYGKVLSIESAAAAIIGCNVGATMTGIIAAFGASAATKRLAWAHVLFNSLTAVVALIALPVFLMVVSNLADFLRVGNNPTHILAVFHTAFNVLGVLLMWPLANQLKKWLLKLYAKPNQQTGIEHPESEYLDPSIANIPDLAMRCISLELKKLLDLSSKLAFQSNNWNQEKAQAHVSIRNKIKESLKRLNSYIELTVKSNLTTKQSNTVTNALSVMHHLNNIYDLHKYCSKRIKSLLETQQNCPKPLQHWLELVNDFNQRAVHEQNLLHKENLNELKRLYQNTKLELMHSAINETIPVSITDNALQTVSLSRRFTKQVTRANLKYLSLELNLHRKDGQTQESEDAEDEDEDETTTSTQKDATAPQAE